VTSGDEHEAAVGNVATVHLNDAGLSQYLGERLNRSRSVMCRRGRVNPPSCIVRPQDLRAAVPILGI
jgi:hypothetical protein